MMEKSTLSKTGLIAYPEDQKNFAFSCLWELFQKGRYSPSIAKDYSNSVRHFCYWLGLKAISLAAVDETVIHEFIDTHSGSCSCPIAKGTRHFYRPALGHFLKVLRAKGITIPAPPLTHPHEAVLQDFGRYLIDAHGLTSSSMGVYLRHTKAFLIYMFADGVALYSSMTVKDIQEHIAIRASMYKAASAKLHCTVLRAFLKFLRVTNELQLPLDEAVPTVAQWKLSTLPRYLDDDQLNTFLSSFSITTPLGLRNRAMALLMATAGLRSDEVAHLTLDDIHWREGSLTLTKTKSRRIDNVPLVAEAGEALAAYLQKGRPTSDIRNVFVTHIAPVGMTLDAYAIRSAMRRAFVRCMPEAPFHGTHVLRHTLATRMLRQGASLKEIADVLRHSTIETTSCYAKVDLNGLQRVVAPWPEVCA